MKALNLSIYTASADSGHKVTMTAEFESHNEAVRFHEGIAKLCRDVSLRDEPQWPRVAKLLTRQ